MPSAKDKLGRPIVVVTGLGIVTSLGAGKTDNWAKLTAGESGIRAITRFPTDGAEDAHRRHHRLSAGAGCHRRAVRESSPSSPPKRRSAQSGIGTHRRFPRAAVPGGAADRDGMAAAARSRRAAPAPTTQSTTTTCCAPAARTFPAITSASCSARSPIISPTNSAPRARRFRYRPPAPPARARSSSASRRSAAAKRMPRFASAPTARSARKR